MTIFDGLTKDTRRELGDVNRVIAALVSAQNELVLRDARLKSSQEEASRGTAGVATDSLERVITELNQAQSAAAERRESIGAQLERLRLELIRLKSGVGTAAEVRADPPRYIGRTVDWRLELIAVQTADELRIEMPKGQTYLLTRGPLPEPGFVYVMVTQSQANEFRSLQALQELTLRVTIKAPRTRFLATPVVELVSRVAE